MMFIERNIEKLVTIENVEEITGYTIEILLELMGLAVIFEDKDIHYFEGIYPELKINVSIPDLSCELTRIFRFDEGTILNEYFEIKRPELRGQRIGTKIFCSQVVAARSEGFNKITVWAVGIYKDIIYWNGYITWGKLGYTMNGKSQMKFKECMYKLNRKEKTLKELLSTKEGEKIWIENGFSWDGEFLLDQYSENSRTLDEYLKSRGYSV